MHTINVVSETGSVCSFVFIYCHSLVSDALHNVTSNTSIGNETLNAKNNQPNNQLNNQNNQPTKTTSHHITKITRQSNQPTNKIHPIHNQVHNKNHQIVMQPPQCSILFRKATLNFCACWQFN